MMTMNNSDLLKKMFGCLEYLDEVCDYAKDQDSKGFSKADTSAGKGLALMGSLAIEDAGVAAFLVNRYRKQLESAGYSVPSLEEMEKFCEEHGVASKISERREVITDRGRAYFEERKQEVIRQKIKEGHKVYIQQTFIIVKFPFESPTFRDKVAAMQPLKDLVPGWAFNRFKEKEWSFPVTATQTVLNAIDPWKDDFIISPEVYNTEAIDAAKEAFKREQEERQRKFLEEMKRLHKVYMFEKRIAIQFPYNAPHFDKKLALMQDLKKELKSGDFNKFFTKEWSFPKKFMGEVLEAIQDYADDFTYAPDLDEHRQAIEAEREQERLEEERKQREREEERVRLLEKVKPYLDGNPFASNGYTLFLHQRETLQYVYEQYGRVIMALDMGLGKTLCSLVAARAYGLPIVVVSPLSVQDDWMEAAKICDQPIQWYSWGKIPEMPEGYKYVVILDEAHLMKNPKAMRSKKAKNLAKKAHAKMLLTGTPYDNGRPIELLNLLDACDHPLAQDPKHYMDYYCDGRMKDVGRTVVYDVTGAAHMDELHEKTKDIIIYKKKKDCIDLPPKQRIMRHVEPSPERKKQYETLLNELRKKFEMHVKDVQTAYEELRQQALENDEELPEYKDPETAAKLVALQHLRHATSIAKVDDAIAMAQEVISQGESVVLFTNFKDVAREIAEVLDCEILSGDVKSDERKRLKADFQAKKTNAIVCTYGAGGVGITLTAAPTVLLLDRPWTPGKVEQSEDRLHRIGQTKTVTSYWLQYGEADEKVDPLLEAKQDRIDLLLEGKRKTMRGVSGSIQDVAFKVLSKVLKEK